MNYGSDDQLIAVAQSCRHFDARESKHISSTMSTAAEETSCNDCNHWDGSKCQINVFDKVLTSLDQE